MTTNDDESTWPLNQENEDQQNKGNNDDDDSILLSLQSYEEQRIHHYEETGEEKYVKKLTDEEQFATMLNRFDFMIKQNITIDHVNDIALVRPKLRDPPKMNPWIKPREMLFDSLSQMEQLVAVTRTLKSREESFLNTISIDDEEEHEDEETEWKCDAEYVNRMYKSKQNQLEVASNILKKGVQQVREKLEKDRSFHHQLYQLQKKWLVKPSKQPLTKQIYNPTAYSTNAVIGNTVPTIDLSNSNTILPLYSYIPVILLRTQDNKLDMKIPAICTYGKRVILASRLIKDGTFTNFDQILESAQQSVFNLELFDLFVASLMNAKRDIAEYQILKYTEHSMSIKLSSLVTLTVSLVSNIRTPFWDLDCQVQLPDKSPIDFKSNMNGQFVKCLLSECLTNLHESFKKNNMNSLRFTTLKNTSGLSTLASINNAQFVDKCVEDFVNVLKHVNHRYYCQQLIQDLFKCHNYGDISLDSSVYPNVTSYRLTLNKSSKNQVYTIVIKGMRAVAQKRQKYSSTTPAPSSAMVSKQVDNRDGEYQLSTKRSRLLEFDSPEELAEYISLLC